MADGLEAGCLEAEILMVVALARSVDNDYISAFRIPLIH